MNTQDLDSRAPLLLDPNDPNPAHRELLVDWLRVQSAFVFRPRDACRALRAGLSPAALWRLAGARPAPGIEPLEPGTRSWRALEASGARALPWHSQAYPARLKRLEDAPPVLWVQGDPEVFARPSVALVGARAATAAGKRTAHELARALARAGVTVISGLARGIDARAHDGALAGNGTTIAVQARGPDDVYPPEHRNLAARIRQAGALLTEFPPFVAPRAAHFPLRNRIISGLAEAVIVVEARVRSGSLITARHALDQGIDVLAVPGPVDAPTSRGTNELLRDGAGVVLEPGDVLLALGLDPLGDAPAAEAHPEPSADPMVSRVAAALAQRAATRDELASRLGCNPEELALAVVELELAGRVECERDGRLRLCRSA